MIGQYGRTNKGKIFEFIWIENANHIMIRQNKKYDDLRSFEKYWFDEDEEITKHSKNIIDLICEGDYVNGYKVDEVRVSCFNSIIFCNIYKLELVESDIKTIVTKEQFESASYKV